MRDPLRGITAIVYKEIRHVRRDPMSFVFAMLIPLVQMIVLGFAIDTNVRQVTTVIYDEDHTREARELVDSLRNSDTFRVVGYVASGGELNEAIVSGRARVGVRIPPDYSRDLLRGRQAQVLVLIDGSDSAVAGQALNVSTAIGLNESLKRALGEGFRPPVQMRARLLFNPDSRSPNFFLPGLMAVLLIISTTFLTAFSLMREKDRGTLEQLFVTPVRPLGLLVGKIIPYFGIGLAELAFILLGTRYIFGVSIHGSVVLLVLLTLPYLFTNLAVGILISSKAETQPQALQLAFSILLPSIFLSGYMFPRETMPLLFYGMNFLVPATYYINIARGVILRGAGIVHVWANGLVLLLMGIGLLLIAARRFRKKVIATLTCPQ